MEQNLDPLLTRKIQLDRFRAAVAEDHAYRKLSRLRKLHRFVRQVHTQDQTVETFVLIDGIFFSGVQRMENVMSQLLFCSCAGTALMEVNKMSVAKPEIRLIRLKEFNRRKNCQTLIEPRMWNWLLPDE